MFVGTVIPIPSLTPGAASVPAFSQPARTSPASSPSASALAGTYGRSPLVVAQQLPVQVDCRRIHASVVALPAAYDAYASVARLAGVARQQSH